MIIAAAHRSVRGKIISSSWLELLPFVQEGSNVLTSASISTEKIYPRDPPFSICVPVAFMWRGRVDVGISTKDIAWRRAAIIYQFYLKKSRDSLKNNLETNDIQQ